MMMEFYLILKAKNPNALYLLYLHIQLKLNQNDHINNLIISITSIDCDYICSEEHVSVMKNIKNPSIHFHTLCFKGFLYNNKIQKQELVDLFSTEVLLMLVNSHCNRHRYSATAQRLIYTDKVYFVLTF